MHKRNSIVFGAVLIILGIFSLMKNFNIINFNYFSIGFIMSKFWPVIFLMIPGLLFHYSFFSKRNNDAGILVPGGILLVTGIVCQLSVIFNIWRIMWPGFILAVAAGLFELYVFGTRDKALLIPVTILGGLSFLFFMSFSLAWLFKWITKRLFTAIVLIICGFFIILKSIKAKDV